MIQPDSPYPTTKTSIEAVLQTLDPVGTGVSDPDTSTSLLDGHEAKRLLGRVRDWRSEEIRRQRTNRRMMAIDHDFYDHIQWQQAHAAELEDRGQAPLTYNRVQLVADFIVGTFVRTKMDWSIMPRKSGEEDAAKVKTACFKYLNDINLTSYKQTATVRESVIGGAGYLEFGVDTDPTKELIFARWGSWREIWIDSRSRSPDYNEDARYIIRDKWIDTDMARAMFWERRDVIARGSARGLVDNGPDWNEELDEQSGDFENAYRYVQASNWNSIENIRPRVLISECWYKLPRRVQFLSGGALHGVKYEPTSELHKIVLKTGDSKVQSTVIQEMRYAFWCSGGLLAEGCSPYNHGMFPIQPLFFRRRNRDNQPYGQIRGIRDAQEDMNQRHSRALWRSSTRRLIYESETFEDEDAVLDQIARPDAKIKVKPGKLNSFKIETDAELMETDVKLMELDAAHIEYGSGVTNEALGRETNASAGVAIGKRQDQVMVTMAPFAESYNLWFKNCGAIQLSLLEQYWTAEREIRVTDERQAPSFMPINQYQYDDTAKQWGIANDVTKCQADFIVASRDFKDSVREALFASFMNLLKDMPPNIVLQLLDVVVEMHPDVPNKRLVLSRIRKVAGLPDPDSALSPEEQQQQQATIALAAQMQQIQLATLNAELQHINALASKETAAGSKYASEELKNRVTAIFESIQGGMSIATVPQVTPAADQILQGAGFKDASGQGLDTSDSPPLEQVAAVAGTNVGKNFTDVPGSGATPTGGPPGTITPPAPRQAEGAQRGIETVRPDST